MATHGFGPGKNRVLVISEEAFEDEVDAVVDPKLAAKQNQHLHLTGSLVVANWTATTGGYTQTIDVTGVTATNTLIISPAATSLEEYGSCIVYATAQGAGTITFFAKYTPSNALTVNVVILGV